VLAPDDHGDDADDATDVDLQTPHVTLEDNILTIDPQDGFLGRFEVAVTVSDGVTTVREAFDVTVENAAPVLQPIGNRTISRNEDSLTITLEATDADGDELTYMAELLGAGADEVTLTLDGNVLTIDPAEEFLGEFQVCVAVSDGLDAAGETVKVSRVNFAPLLEPIADQSMSHSEDAITVELAATDADSDQLSYTARIVSEDPLAETAYNLDQQLNLYYEAANYENCFGLQEKFLLSEDGSWYYILPNGEFYSWGGSIESSTLLATFNAGYHTDPSLLFEAEAPRSVFVRSNVSVTVSDNVLTIDPAEGFAGEFNVCVTVSDGIATDEETFVVSVTNAAPVLEAIGERTMPHTDDVTTVVLAASDADGDQLDFSVELVTPGMDSVVLSLAGNVLTIDPAAEFAGEFEVRASVSDGFATVEQTFTVVVTNSGPTLEPIADRTMPHTDDVITVELAASDADADQLQYSAEILAVNPAAVLAYNLDQQFDFNYEAAYYENSFGLQEKYLLAEDGTWYYILPDGALYRFAGSIESSTPLATLNSSYYNDTTLLQEAPHPGTLSVEDQVTVEVSGNVPTIDPAAGFASEFDVRVAVTDGIATVGQTFGVLVTNAAPVLEPIGDRTMPHTQDTMTVELAASDADGDQLGYTAELIGPRQGNVTLNLTGNELTIDPADGFAVGGFVRVTVGDGFATVAETFGVSVTNAAPALEPIGDRTMPHTQDTMSIELEATDADGDQLSYSVQLSQDKVVEGVIGLVGDQDWFAFEAVAEATYHFHTELLGLADSVLSLYGQDGTTLLAQDNDGGAGLASSITWTAEADGTHYLAVAADDGTGGGEYRVHFDVGVNPDGAPQADLAGVAYDGQQMTVWGTRGDDEFAFDAQRHQVTINGSVYTFDPTLITSISFDGVGGDDTAEIKGSAGDDNFTAAPNATTLTGSGYQLEVTNTAVINAIGAGGTDVAKLFDSAGDDLFVATSFYGALSGDGFYNQAEGFQGVHCYATAGGTDVAKLYDSAGNDHFHASPNYGAMTGEGFFNEARGFKGVHGYSTAGGVDLAKLFDSGGDDVLYATPSEASLLGEGFFNRVKHFAGVHAYGTGGGRDTAWLYDSAGDDLLEAANDWARIAYGDRCVWSSNFQRVKAISSSGGTDTKQIQAIDFALETEDPWLDYWGS